jgi:hypothetical protein
MNGTSAVGRQVRAGQEKAAEEKAGRIILLAASILSALLVIAGLIYASGTGQRDHAALAAGGCEPGLSSETAACTTQPMLASQYAAVLTPATRQLTVEQAAYTAYEGRDLAAAAGALMAEATTEQAFDTSLAAVRFPPAIAPIAGALIRANQARANLTAQQARSATLAKMRSFNPRVQAAAAVVATELNFILKAVDTPVRAG